MKDINKYIGGSLREIREQKGISQRKVSEIMSLHKSTICYWESGRRQINVSDFVAYLDAIGASQKERENVAKKIANPTL